MNRPSVPRMLIVIGTTIIIVINTVTKSRPLLKGYASTLRIHSSICMKYKITMGVARRLNAVRGTAQGEGVEVRAAPRVVKRLFVIIENTPSDAVGKPTDAGSPLAGSYFGPPGVPRVLRCSEGAGRVSGIIPASSRVGTRYWRVGRSPTFTWFPDCSGCVGNAIARCGLRQRDTRTVACAGAVQAGAEGI